jgi:two-component system, OmpR family, phosphate regulon sensor histidine kinase PhoR
MRGVGFFWKVFGGTLAVVLLSALVIYSSVSSTLGERVEEESRIRVAQQAELVAELAFESWSLETRSASQDAMGRVAVDLQGSRVTLIEADGTVSFDSHEDPIVMDNHAQRAEVLNPGKAVRRYSRTLGREMLYCASAVNVEGEPEFYARVAMATVDIEAQIGALRRAVRDGVLLAALASMLFAALFARRITGPLSRIAGLVDEVGMGRTARRLKVESADEVGQLARAVNEMADDLHGQIDRIEHDRSEREAILATIGDGLVALDSERRVLYINLPACELLGVSTGQVVGDPLLDLARHPILVDILNKCSESSETVHSPGTFGAGEAERYVQLSATPLVEVEGVGGGCVLVLRDVTELRRLESVRRDFVTNVSHELKTPLTAMRGYVEAVISDTDMDAELRESFLSKAHRNTHRLASIVTDLLSLSRLESDEREFVLESRDVSELFREAESEMADYAESRNIKVLLPEPEPPIKVLVDTPAITLALTNLISNAIRYSAEGGEVKLSVCAAEGEVRLEVQDQGAGIPPAELDRIFERFYRVDKARSRSLGGTGLGLSIVRHVVNAHGGRIEVQSAPGEGSTFSIVLTAD